MAVYTDISDTELATFVADFDVGEAVSFKGIAEGVENSNFLLETRRGRYILTIYERRVQAQDLPFFLSLMQWLANAGYPSAAPIADRAGEMLKRLRGKPAALIGFLPGLSASRPSVAQCREAGEGLGWLHVASQGFTARRLNDLGQPSWAPMAARLAPAAESLKPGLGGAIEADAAYIAAHWPEGLPEGVVHADYFPDNVFFDAGRFAGTIDFYFAATDALAYDIAVALNAWCFEPDGSFDIIAARAFIDGYQRRRQLTEVERGALPLLARGAALRFFLTRLDDWGVTPAGALVVPKDPLEYERKLAVHRAGLTLFEDA